MTAPDLRGGPNLDIRTAVFNRSALDRLNNHRKQPTFTRCHFTPHSRVLVFSPSLQVLVHNDPSVSLALLQPSLVPLLQHRIAQSTHTDPPLVILGKDQHDKSYLALRLAETFDSAAWLPTLTSHYANLKFVNLRSVSGSLNDAHASMAAQARSMFEFHARHAFCGTCGSPTVSEQGGTRRRCTKNVDAVEPVTGDGLQQQSHSQPPSCNGMWFPRVDPVVIMLVVHATGDRVLLGRQKRFRDGLYSCLAGFMEYGEGVDDAVRREVLEEAGVVVERVRFFGSQAWPFPYSLMLGCVAQASADATIHVDEHELEHAQWFSRDDVQLMVHRARSLASGNDITGMVVPPVSAIAGQMLAAYAAGEPLTSFSETAVPRSRPSPAL